MDKKYICKDNSRGGYALMVPVYYDYETRPAWRIAARGSLEDVRKAYEAAPDQMKATEEENRNNRQWKRAEMLLLYDHGKKAAAEAIKKQYKL